MYVVCLSPQFDFFFYTLSPLLPISINQFWPYSASLVNRISVLPNEPHIELPEK